MHARRLLVTGAMLLIAGGLLLALAERLVPTQSMGGHASQAAADLLAATSRGDFYRNMEPLAKREAQLVLYNHAASFPAFWSDIVIPRFEARYGIKVVLRNVKDNVAHQQLMASHAAARPAPVDVFFTSSTHLPAYLSQGVMLAIPLSEHLPEAAFYDTAALQRNQGVAHNGRFMPFHRNQAAFGYNSLRVSDAEVPDSLDALMTWTHLHPGRLAWSSPLTGGSGKALLVAAARHTMPAACRSRFEANDSAVTQQKLQQWMRDSNCLSATWAWLRSLRAASEMTNGNAESLSLIANGKAWMAVVWEDQAHTFLIDKQLPPSFRVTLPMEGLPGGIDGLFIPDGARHVAAAALFIDFALSADIQRWKLENRGSRSARTDLARRAGNPNLLSEEQIATRSQAWPGPAVVQALVDGFVENVLQQELN